LTLKQIAAILSHEIGHYYLKHSEKAINDYIKTKFSREVKEEEIRIRSLEFNKSSAAQELLKKSFITKTK
jgi:predicted HD phosphohydrolase